jgi:hypothetical protein
MTSMQRALSVLAFLPLSGWAQTSAYYSVVRTDMPEHYSLIAVQKLASREACNRAKDEYAKQMREKCPTCKVRRSSCDSKLSSREAALWSAKPVNRYTVIAGDTRLLLIGNGKVAAGQCAALARELSARKLGAECIPPGKPHS